MLKYTEHTKSKKACQDSSVIISEFGVLEFSSCGDLKKWGYSRWPVLELLKEEVHCLHYVEG